MNQNITFFFVQSVLQFMKQNDWRQVGSAVEYTTEYLLKLKNHSPVVSWL